MRWADTILGKSVLHKVLKPMTLVVPTVVAVLWDSIAETQYFVPSLVAGFLTMSFMIYYNIEKARKPG